MADGNPGVGGGGCSACPCLMNGRSREFLGRRCQYVLLVVIGTYDRYTVRELYVKLCVKDDWQDTCWGITKNSCSIYFFSFSSMPNSEHILYAARCEAAFLVYLTPSVVLRTPSSPT